MIFCLQLSEEDAAAIATAIRDEIATTHLEEQLSLSLEQVTGLSLLSAWCCCLTLALCKVGRRLHYFLKMWLVDIGCPGCRVIMMRGYLSVLHQAILV